MQLKRKHPILYQCILSTFIFGLIAHAFAFLNFNISHDSLDDFAGNNISKIAIGRFLTPVIQAIFGQNFIAPWLIGVISLLLIGLSVYFIVKTFNLKNNWQIALLSGIFSTNLTVTAITATYQEDLIVDCCALLFACLATYFWSLTTSKSYIKYSLLSILFIILQLGCYQSYLSVMLVAIIIYSIRDILDKKPFKTFFTRGILGIIITIMAGLIYFGLSNIFCLLSNVAVNDNSYNSLSTIWTTKSLIFQKALKSYLHVIWNLFAPTYSTNIDFSLIQPLSSQNFLPYATSIINITLLIMVVITIIRRSRTLELKSKITLVMLILITPFVMNLSHLLSGDSHELMYFSFCLFYLFIIVIFDLIKPQQLSITKLLVVSLSVIILSNIAVSNRIYTKKQIDTASTNLFMNRLVTQIENQPIYQYNSTPVYLIGIPNLECPKAYNDLTDITGVWRCSSITREELYSDYFQYVLNYKINLVTDPQQQQDLDQLEMVKEMPTYPNPKSIQIINDTIVVKISERKK